MQSLPPVTFAALLLTFAACSSTDPTTPDAPGGAASGGVGGSAISGSSSVAGSNTTTNGGGGASAGGMPTTGGTSAGGAGTGGVATGGGGSGGSAGAAGGSAGAAGSAGTGGGGPVAYNPCPTNGNACRVMPLGDSITDGCCGENTLSMGASYRLELFRLSLNNNKKLTFVGSHSSGPNMVDNVAFPKMQEGHSGWTIADGGGRSGLQQQIVGWLQQSPPDIITLMIGTNDVGIQLDLPNAPKRLGTLIDTITQTSPKALLVVAQIVPTRTDSENTRVQAFNAAIPGVVKGFADQGKHVIVVDMYGAYTKQTDFKTALMANDLHPTDAGYAVMANTWWPAISALLPAK